MKERQAIGSRAWQSLLMVATWLVLGMASAHAGNTVTKVTLVMTDAQGNVLMTTDVHGNITARYTYRPYGMQQSGPTNKGPSYTGHVNDPDTGLVYMQQRYYDPDGRFISPDPIRPTPGNIYNFNRYAYANNNPVVNVDPDGRKCLYSDGGQCRTDPEVSPAVQRLRDTSDCGGCIQPTIATYQASRHAGVPDPNSVPGGPWTPHDKPGQFQGPKPKDGVGGRRRLQYVPPKGEGGPPGSKGYWKVNEPGQKGWQRYNIKGKRITPEQAHPGKRLIPLPPMRPIPPAVDLGPVICFTCQILIQELKVQQKTPGA